MSTTGNQSITVNSAERVYSPAWVAKYAQDLKKGNTATKKAAIDGGASFYRLTHDASKGIERHVFSLEDITQDSTTGEQTMEKIQVTLTCKADDSTAEARLVNLAIGMCSYLAATGVLTSIVADEL